MKFVKKFENRQKTRNTESLPCVEIGFQVFFLITIKVMRLYASPLDSNNTQHFPTTWLPGAGPGGCGAVAAPEALRRVVGTTGSANPL